MHCAVPELLPDESNPQLPAELLNAQAVSDAISDRKRLYVISIDGQGVRVDAIGRTLGVAPL